MQFHLAQKSENSNNRWIVKSFAAHTEEKNTEAWITTQKYQKIKHNAI